MDYAFYKNGGWNYGVGGSTPTPNSLVLRVDTESEIPRTELLETAKATYYHESYHLARGYSFESRGLTLIEVAIEEELATKFEIDTAGSSPLYGHYGNRMTMLATFEEVKKADLVGDRDWRKWEFYYPGEAPEQDRHWILYRVGTFIAEEALANNPELKIQDLAALTCQEILELTKL